ncbi:MAG: dihydrofolate reductase family protein [Patescibacteria group bacterium]|nr:dihydrofolate reductase family protein [Patescibacteria group bacterium]
MRKIIVQEMITVDGFFAGLHGEINWHNVDVEFNEQAIIFLDTVDTLIFGHTTYDLMASYWPTPEGLKDDPLVATKMNALAKIIFSKTLKNAVWSNSKVLNEINPEKILEMKRSRGKNIAIFGSGTIVSALADMGLVDEYRLIINPIILREGKILFAHMKKNQNLKLVSTKTFKSGNVLLCYVPV